MKITRCSGADVHFFDGDKYQVCPVCGKPSIESAGGAVATPTPVSQPQADNKAAEPAKHKGLFGLGKKKDKPAEPQYVPAAPVADTNEGGTIAMTEVLANQSIQRETATPEPTPVVAPAPAPVPAAEPKVSTISQMVPPVPPMPEPQPVSQPVPQPMSVHECHVISA